jgi:hypothetical protein
MASPARCSYTSLLSWNPASCSLVAPVGKYWRISVISPSMSQSSGSSPAAQLADTMLSTAELSTSMVRALRSSPSRIM